MLNIIKAESLKMRRTSARGAVFVGPLMVLMLLLLVGRSYIDVNGYNWWYMELSPIFVGIIAAAFFQKDRGFRFKSIRGGDVSQVRIWSGKVLAAWIYVLISNIFMMILLEGSAWVIGSQIGDIPILKGFQCVLTSSICSLWIIPFVMILCDIAGLVWAHGINFVAQGIGIALAAKGVWWGFPHAWSSRVLVPILEVFPNGLMVPEGHEILGGWSTILGTVLSLSLGGLLTVILIELMKWRSGNA